MKTMKSLRTLMNAAAMLVTTGAMLLSASAALAAGYCDDKTACASASDTCLGSVCVPTTKVCKADSACNSWEICNKTCPGGANVGTVEVSPPGSGTDGGSSSGGSSGSGCASSDGDACATPVPDPKDAGSIPVPNSATCPTDKGVCTADLSKVKTQPGCEALCQGVLSCNLGGSGTTSVSSGGSSGSGGGGVPPSADDGGPSPAPDAGAVPVQPDASSDPSKPDDAAIDPVDAYDGKPVTPNANDLAQCVQMCSLWVLDKVAPAELAAVEVCIASNTSDCKKMATDCQSTADALGKALAKDDSWLIGVEGVGYATSGSSNTSGAAGQDKSADAAAPLAAGADAGGHANAAASSASSGGCTASGGSASLDAFWLVLASLGLLVSRRREVASVKAYVSEVAE